MAKSGATQRQGGLLSVSCLCCLGAELVGRRGPGSHGHQYVPGMAGYGRARGRVWLLAWPCSCAGWFVQDVALHGLAGCHRVKQIDFGVDLPTLEVLDTIKGLVCAPPAGPHARTAAARSFACSTPRKQNIWVPVPYFGQRGLLIKLPRLYGISDRIE